MSTIPNPKDFLFNETAETPVVEDTIDNTINEEEVDPTTLPWDTFTIGGHNVVDLLVENISELINNSTEAFKKDREINFTFGDLYKVIDRLHNEYGYDSDNSDDMFCAVDKFGYGYKQYLVEAALDKFTEAGWDVDVTYNKFYSLDEAKSTVAEAYKVLDKVPFFGVLFNKDNEDDFNDLVDSVWVSNNLLLSNDNVITISPEEDDYEDMESELADILDTIEPVEPAEETSDANIEHEITKNEDLFAKEADIEAMKKDENYKKFRQNIVDELVNEFASLFDAIETDKPKKDKESKNDVE